MDPVGRPQGKVISLRNVRFVKPWRLVMPVSCAQGVRCDDDDNDDDDDDGSGGADG